MLLQPPHQGKETTGRKVRKPALGAGVEEAMTAFPSRGPHSRGHHPARPTLDGSRAGRGSAGRPRGNKAPHGWVAASKVKTGRREPRAVGSGGRSDAALAALSGTVGAPTEAPHGWKGTAPVCMLSHCAPNPSGWW